MHPLLAFTRDGRALIAAAFTDVISACKYTCYACAIMADHVHILLRKHRHTVEEMSLNLHRAGATVLQAIYLHHPIWSHGIGWKVFLDHPDEVRRTIPYIDHNPIKIGLPKRNWPFVKPYDNWPLHIGHNPNSPWARRLHVR